MDINRIGTVSKIDKENGMVSVVYPDRDNNVTDLVPCISFNDEYKMPKVGDKVFLAHLSNGTEAALAFGKFWNEANKPLDKEDTYRKQFDYDGKAYMKYDEKTGELLIQAPKIKIVSDEKELEAIAMSYLITAKNKKMDINSNIFISGEVSHQ